MLDSSAFSEHTQINKEKRKEGEKDDENQQTHFFSCPQVAMKALLNNI